MSGVPKTIPTRRTRGTQNIVAIKAKTYYSDVIRIHRLLRWLSGKVSSRSAGDAGSVPGLGRSPGEGSGNTL